MGFSWNCISGFKYRYVLGIYYSIVQFQGGENGRNNQIDSEEFWKIANLRGTDFSWEMDRDGRSGGMNFEAGDGQWWILVRGEAFNTNLGGLVSNIFCFHPYLGKWPILTNIFQMGWNHQLDFHVMAQTMIPCIRHLIQIFFESHCFYTFHVYSS